VGSLGGLAAAASTTPLFEFEDSAEG